MPMVFRFTVLSDENDAFVREYEVPYDATLLDFHLFICADLRFDPGHMTSFFLSDREWERHAEFTLHDMDEVGDPDAPRPMEEVLLGQVVRNERERLIYLFDQLEQRALYLELTATLRAEDRVDYPRVARSEGNPPAMDGGPEGSGGSIFDDIMSEFNDFEGDDSYDDE